MFNGEAFDKKVVILAGAARPPFGRGQSTASGSVVGQRPG